MIGCWHLTKWLGLATGDNLVCLLCLASPSATSPSGKPVVRSLPSQKYSASKVLPPLPCVASHAAFPPVSILSGLLAMIFHSLHLRVRLAGFWPLLGDSFRCHARHWQVRSRLGLSKERPKFSQLDTEVERGGGWIITSKLLNRATGGKAAGVLTQAKGKGNRWQNLASSVWSLPYAWLGREGSWNWLAGRWSS